MIEIAGSLNQVTELLTGKTHTRISTDSLLTGVIWTFKDVTGFSYLDIGDGFNPDETLRRIVTRVQPAAKFAVYSFREGAADPGPISTLVTDQTKLTGKAWHKLWCAMGLCGVYAGDVRLSAQTWLARLPRPLMNQ